MTAVRTADQPAASNTVRYAEGVTMPDHKQPEDLPLEHALASAAKLTTAEEQQRNDEERKLLRRLQMMMTMVQQVIAQDGSLTVDEASRMIADSREAALAMFPGKELAYDLIWKPRFRRLMIERFRLQ